MKRIGSATDGAFRLAGPSEGGPVRGDDDGAGVDPAENRGRLSVTDSLTGWTAVRMLMAEMVWSRAANAGDEAPVSLFFARADEAALLEESVEVHWPPVRLGFQCGALRQRGEGFENLHQRLWWLQTPGVQFDDGFTHTDSNVANRGQSALMRVKCPRQTESRFHSSFVPRG